MRKIISFSLWRTSKNDHKRFGHYIDGAFSNLKLAKVIYPDWEVHFWLGKSSISKDVERQLEEAGAQIHRFNDNHDWWGLYVRFVQAGKVDCFMAKDCDSYLNWREQAAVNEWIKSGRKWHMMRDNLHHNIPMVGDLWGCRKGAIKNMRKYITRWYNANYPKSNNFGGDQKFLTQVIWPLAKKNCMQHDIMNRKFNSGWKPFPYHRSIAPFKHVGQSRTNRLTTVEFAIDAIGDSKALAAKQVELAQKSKGPIMEIGVLNGKTARRFSKNTDQQVFGIDPIIMDSMSRTLIGNEAKIREIEKEYDNYTFYKDYSYNVVKNWTIPLGYIFIDGDHKYLAVRQDYRDWFPHVKKGGYIGFHDSACNRGGPRHWPGPTRLVNNLMNNPKLEYIETVWCLTIFRKR